MSGYPPPSGYNNPGYPSAPGSAYGTQGFPQQGQNQPASGYGPPPVAGFVAPSAPGYGAPQMGGYGAPSISGYGAPPAGDHGATSAGAYGAPQTGVYGAPLAGGYGTPQAGGYGAPPAGIYGAPSAGAYGAPQAGAYGAPVASAHGTPPAGGYGTNPIGSYGAPLAGGYGAPQTGVYGVPAAGGYGTPPAGSYGAAPNRPTLRPAPNFNAGQDAEDLRKAMRGLGTDEKKIISILSKRSAIQRKLIAEKYKASFGKSLEKELASELNGNFEEVILASLMDPAHLQAKACFDAIKGAGTREETLIQIFVVSTNAELQLIKQAYSQLYNSNIEKDVCGDTSGDFERILVSILQCSREEGRPLDRNQAAADADALYASGERRVGTEEATFNRILSQRSFPHIKEVANIYLQKYGKSLAKAICRETSGYYEKTLVSIVKFAENRCEMLAESLHATMLGAGTRDSDLIRLVLTRSELDLEDIKDAYARIYNKTLGRAIESDTSGDYKRFLLAVVDGH